MRIVSDTHVVRGSDGGALHVDVFGEPDGKPVLVHHGSPGSRRLFQPDAELASREFGLRLLSYDRPGYGGRPPQPGRRIADAVADVRLVIEALGVDRLGMWGFSGGGPYALACAALLPDLVTGAAVFSTFAPYGAPGLDFCGAWPEEYRREVDLFFTDRATARDHWRRDSEEFYEACSEPGGWMARWGEVAGTDESHGWEVAAHLATEVRDSLANGDEGYWDDWVATLSSWGFEVSTVRVPVRLWHGTRDQNVPVTNGHWLADHIPGIEVEFPDGEDHTDLEHCHRAAAYRWLAGLADDP